MRLPGAMRSQKGLTGRAACRSFHGAVKDREFTDAEVNRLARYQMATIEKVCPLQQRRRRQPTASMPLCPLTTMHAGAPSRARSGTRRAALLARPTSQALSVQSSTRQNTSSAASARRVLRSGCHDQLLYCTGTVCLTLGESSATPSWLAYGR